jgi:ABC-type antimicrobial peptide transport system permease subunit
MRETRKLGRSRPRRWALGALGLTRLLASLLYGVGPADPVTFVVTAAVMFAAVLMASLIPAQRASRIDTLQALRHD